MYSKAQAYITALMCHPNAVFKFSPPMMHSDTPQIAALEWQFSLHRIFPC